MSEFNFKLPDVGEGIAESEVATWRVAVGDTIKEEQPLVDMLTDKAAIEIPSPVAGKVLKLHAAAGDKVPVGSVLVTIETEGAAPAEKGKPAPATPTPVAVGAGHARDRGRAALGMGDHVLVQHAARRMAAAHRAQVHAHLARTRANRGCGGGMFVVEITLVVIPAQAGIQGRCR